MNKICGIALALAIVATPAFGAERTGTEMLFDTGHLTHITTGSTLIYSHERSAVDEIEHQSIEGGAISVQVFPEQDQRRLKVVLSDSHRKRGLEHFPADRGNPVFIVFLESTLSAIAKASGGSPFYLRNRIKEALSGGGDLSDTAITVEDESVAAMQITYHPFANDRNREKLGKALADLRIVIIMSKDVPGEFIELTARGEADGKTAFVETIRFVKMEEAK